MDLLPELYQLVLLFLVFHLQMLVVPEQMNKVIGLLLQLLVDVPASAVFPVLLMVKFLLEPIDLCIRHSSQLILLLQHFFFFLL